MTAYNAEKWEMCGTIADLEERNDLILITDSQNVADVLESIGELDCVNDFTGLLVKAENGEYTEIYTFYGIPYLYKTIWRFKWEK
jgi:hypothetical protein